MKKADLSNIVIENILLNVFKENNAVLKSSPKSREKVIDVQVSDDVFYQIIFYLLDNNPPFRFFEKIILVHKNISKVIQDILHNTDGDYDWICNTSTHVCNYWPRYWPTDPSAKVGCIEDIERFVFSYNEAFIATKKDFIDNYMDINNLIHDCSQSYDNWPKNMMAHDVGFSLIGFGILNNDNSYILKGRELLKEKKKQLTGLSEIGHNAIDFMIAYTSKF